MNTGLVHLALQLTTAFVVLHSGFSLFFGIQKFKQLKRHRGIRLMRVIVTKSMRQSTFQYSMTVFTIMYLLYLFYVVD